jgi:cysteinyl-tRNA synthetase
MPRVPTRSRRTLSLVSGLAALVAAALPTTGAGAAQARPAWDSVSSFAIQNSGFADDGLARVAAADRDLVIVGRFNAAAQPWTRAEVDEAGHDKWILSYMSVAEAQRSEWYWQPEWNQSPPSWVVGQNPWWYNNVYTEVSDVRWKNIIGDHLDLLLAQGFDGVFLDVVDAYWFPDYPGGPSLVNMGESASMVCEIATWVRARDPNFKIVVNNAVNLVYDIPGYADCIDGTMIEGLWWFTDKVPRDETYRSQKIAELRTHQAAGKPIFALDYAPPADQPRIRAEAAALRYRLFFTDFGITNPVS